MSMMSRVSSRVLVGLLVGLPSVVHAQRVDRSTSNGLLSPGSVAPTSVVRARDDDAELTRRIYVLAFRAGVRQGCRYGAADPVGSALTSVRAVAAGVDAASRSTLVAALDSAAAQYVREGACAELGGPTRVVVVDQFHGAAWRASRKALFGDAGTRGGDGLSTVTRQVQVGPASGRRVRAEAEYTFTAQGGTLVAGRDRVAADDRTVGERWDVVERDVVARYPTLLVSRTGRATGRADDATRWRTVFTNPDTQAIEATLSAARDAAGALRITAEYPGLSGR